MARITVEDCLNNVENRFELVLVAAKRARDISRKGLEPLVPADNDKPSVIALREIAAGLVDAKVLDDIQPEATPVSNNVESNNSEYNTQQPFIPKVSLSSHGIKDVPNKLPEVLLKQDSNVTLSSKIIPVRLKDFSAQNEKVEQQNTVAENKDNSLNTNELSSHDSIENNVEDKNNDSLIENNIDDTKDNNQS